MANECIKTAAKQCGVKLWELASEIGVTDSTFSRQLRVELPVERQQQVLSTIHQIASRKARQNES